ncbi:GAF domain-containing protein, partial [Patulibacter sp. S7RM1-6]
AAGAPSAAEEPERRAARAFGELLLATPDGDGLDAFLRPAAEALRDLVGVRRCTVYLRDGRSRRFRGRLGVPATLDPVVRRLVLGGPSDALTADIVDTGAAVAIPDVLADARGALAAIRQGGTRSLLGVPMSHGGELLGLAFLDDERRRRAFDADDVRAAQAFASLVARWLDRTLRVAQLSVARDELVRERVGLRRATLAEQRLAQLPRGEAGAPDVLAIVAELTGRPVRLHAPDGALLERADPADGEPSADLGPTAVAAIRDAMADAVPGRAAVVEPDLGRGLPRRVLAAPVALGAGSGLLVLAEHGMRLGAPDGLIAARAAAALATVERHRRTAAARREDVRALLLAHLLGEHPAPDLVDRLAAGTGLVRDRPRLVATVDLGGDGAADDALLEAATSAAAPLA